MASGGVLQQQGNTPAGFLEVDAVIVPAQLQVHIPSDRAVETRHRARFGLRRHTFGNQRRPIGGRFALRWRWAEQFHGAL